jgi:hypothetical protein
MQNFCKEIAISGELFNSDRSFAPLWTLRSRQVESLHPMKPSEFKIAGHPERVRLSSLLHHNAACYTVDRGLLTMLIPRLRDDRRQALDQQT